LADVPLGPLSTYDGLGSEEPLQLVGRLVERELGADAAVPTAEQVVAEF
jgi:hypothetical protein